MRVNLRAEVAGEGQEKHGDHHRVFAAENTKLAGGIAGVTDAGIVGAKSVEVLEGSANCAVRPIGELVAEIAEGKVVVAARSAGKSFGILAGIGDADFQIGFILAAKIAVEGVLEIAPQGQQLRVANIDALQFGVEVGE